MVYSGGPPTECCRKKIMQKVSALSQKIPGTNEVRTLMRFRTHAARIAQGVPIFVTWSPDEKHNLIMLRLNRARENDPAVSRDFSKKYGSIYEPWINRDLISMPLDEVFNIIPSYDQRRSLISRDALACVDGFRTIVQLCMEHLLGLRFVLHVQIVSAPIILGAMLNPKVAF